MLINRRQSDKHDCYDGDHVYYPSGDWPHNYHARCGKCGAQDWNIGHRLILFLCLPHMAAVWYATGSKDW